jgi:hypothetical protein
MRPQSARCRRMQSSGRRDQGGSLRARANCRCTTCWLNSQPTLLFPSRSRWKALRRPKCGRNRSTTRHRPCSSIAAVSNPAQQRLIRPVDESGESFRPEVSRSENGACEPAIRNSLEPNVPKPTRTALSDRKGWLESHRSSEQSWSQPRSVEGFAFPLRTGNSTILPVLWRDPKK